MCDGDAKPTEMMWRHGFSAVWLVHGFYAALSPQLNLQL
jgi:hypothetical protein